MPIRKWTNWDQGSAGDNLFELLETVKTDTQRQAMQQRYNVCLLDRRRARRLGENRLALIRRRRPKH